MRPTPTITPTDSRVKVTPHMPTTLQMEKATTTEPMQMLIIILGRSVWVMHTATHIVTDATMKATITSPTTTTHFEPRLAYLSFCFRSISVSWFRLRVLVCSQVCPSALKLRYCSFPCACTSLRLVSAARPLRPEARLHDYCRRC